MTENLDRFAGLNGDQKRALLKKMLAEAGPTPRQRQGFALPPEYASFRARLETSGEEGLADIFYRNFDGINAHRAVMGGVEFINFCSYNYLGLSGDRRVSDAAKDAIDTYGTSVSASRLVSGERPLHGALEMALARWIGTEAAISFVGGFSTNEDVIGHLMSEGDLIIYDSLIHASVQQGARLSGATTLPFPHNNFDALDTILKRRRGQARQVLIVVEGVYSMDGDIPDLPALLDIKRRHNALVMVDEAHSMGVLGATGRGLSEYAGVAAGDIDLWMGTLSKSFASCGGYIAGSQEIVSYLRHTSPGFVFSVGMSPPLAAAAYAALQVLEAEPERVAQLNARTAQFHALAGARGLDLGPANPAAAVVPIMVGDSNKAARLSHALVRRGILALPIGFPAVPENKARLRLFLSSTHTEDEIRSAADSIADELDHAGEGKS
ncbi:MAG: aminotransferase class I/II-fold pyridoxal phosphate-dependent enzyme [Sphingomonadales bacterium]|nr:aminotransferase class I/II-fold pyridoxal phosphate-dependent enzyme [Sphingomonadales bacterium]